MNYAGWSIEALYSGFTYLLHECEGRSGEAWCTRTEIDGEEVGEWRCFNCNETAPKGIQDAADLAGCVSIGKY